MKADESSTTLTLKIRPEQLLARGKRQPKVEVATKDKKSGQGAVKAENAVKKVKKATPPNPIAGKKRKSWRILKELHKRFPDAIDSFNPKPLKIGIFEDIIAAVASDPKWIWSETITQYAVRQHTRSKSYHKALVEGGARYALDGTQCGEVTDEEKEKSLLRLALYAKVEEERKRTSQAESQQSDCEQSKNVM